MRDIEERIWRTGDEVTVSDLVLLLDGAFVRDDVGTVPAGSNAKIWGFTKAVLLIVRGR